MNLDKLVYEYVQNNSDWQNLPDIGCPNCNRGLIPDVTFVEYGSQTVKLESFETCDCVYQSNWLKARVFVKQLKQEIKEI